jgi:ABC-2 type transport system ATP-binding protein
MMFRCERLVKRYGRVTALNGLTLAVERGLVGLLGPNGAGKSTLISVLLGQTPATSGRAEVLDLDVRRQRRRVRQHVGFMPENDCLIGGMSGTGYVYYTARLAGFSHAEAMQRTHAVLDYVDLDEVRYRPAEQYSTGTKQRLKLAQALVHDPDVLFLDEPTNGMDPHGRQVMLSLIGDLGRAGISVLLSSHLLPDVERICERVVILGGGEVLATGRIADMSHADPTRYTVDYAGDGPQLVRRLQECRVVVHSQTGSALAVELPAADEQGLVFCAAREAGATIRGLHPKRSSLEETFMTAIRRQESRSA